MDCYLKLGPPTQHEKEMLIRVPFSQGAMLIVARFFGHTICHYWCLFASRRDLVPQRESSGCGLVPRDSLRSANYRGGHHSGNLQPA